MNTGQINLEDIDEYEFHVRFSPGKRGLWERVEAECSRCLRARLRNLLYRITINIGFQGVMPAF